MNYFYKNTPVPAWYELGVKDGSTLLLRVHRAAFESLKARPWATAPMVRSFREAFALDPFVEPAEGSCGFGGALGRGVSNRPDWIVWEVPLPKIGSDDKRGDLWTKVQVLNLRATLSVFLDTGLYLYGDDEKNSAGTGWPEEQLLVIQAVCLPDPGDMGGAHTGSVCVSVSAPVSRWVAAQTPGHHPEIAEAMLRAHERIWQTTDWRGDGRLGSVYGFGALCRPDGRLILDVPGSACGLGPDGSALCEGCGYELVPHNMDSALQQFSILAGLAKLHDLVREDQRASRAP